VEDDNSLKHKEKNLVKNEVVGVLCPVCGGQTWHYRSVAEWGEYRQCSSCGLRFANPLILPNLPEELYERAYQGDISSKLEVKSGMHNYIYRLQLWQAIKVARIKPEVFLRSAYWEVLAFLRRKVPQGSVILEIGCSSGFFLDVLRQWGYKPFGLEVSRSIVETLRAQGYSVWHGTVDTVPDGWVEPQVCLSFFVLHHIPDPINFLKSIRTKYPSAILILAVHNHLGLGIHRTTYPPRDLILWGEKPLRVALERAGYKVELLVPKLVGTEFPIHDLIPGLLGVLAKLGRILPPPVFAGLYRFYLWMVKAFTLPVVLLYRWKKWSPSLVAIGWPKVLS
jgi:SAM-dependent methyltransferase